MYRVHQKNFSPDDPLAPMAAMDKYLEEHPSYVPISVQWLHGIAVLHCREQVVKRRETLSLKNRKPKGGGK